MSFRCPHCGNLAFFRQSSFKTTLTTISCIGWVGQASRTMRLQLQGRYKVTLQQSPPVLSASLTDKCRAGQHLYH